MQTIVDRQAILMVGQKQQVMDSLQSLCLMYGPDIALTDLLRLLRQ